MEAAWFSNSGWGYHSFQHAVRGQVALSANGLEGIPIVNVENACACGSTALHSAWAAIKAGIYDCVLAIGAEKMYDNDRAKTMMFFMSGSDVEELPAFMAKFQEEERLRREKEAQEKGIEPPKEQPGGHSAFMDLYSIGARMHMEKYGTTQRQLACIAAKAHNNSVHNPLAQFTFPMTVEEVLADREVSYPLTRAMCAPVGDGAAAAVLCSERFLQRSCGRAGPSVSVHPCSGPVRGKVRATSARGHRRPPTRWPASDPRTSMWSRSTMQRPSVSCIRPSRWASAPWEREVLLPRAGPRPSAERSRSTRAGG